MISAFFCFLVRADFIKTWKGQHDMKRRSAICGEIKAHITNRAVACPKDAGLSRHPGPLACIRLYLLTAVCSHICVTWRCQNMGRFIIERKGVKKGFNCGGSRTKRGPKLAVDPFISQHNG